MRIVGKGAVRSVVPDDGGRLSTVVVSGFWKPHPCRAHVELTLEDSEARLFAAQYRRPEAVRVTVEVDEPESPPKAAKPAPRASAGHAEGDEPVTLLDVIAAGGIDGIGIEDIDMHEIQRLVDLGVVETIATDWTDTCIERVRLSHREFARRIVEALIVPDDEEAIGQALLVLKGGA